MGSLLTAPSCWIGPWPYRVFRNAPRSAGPSAGRSLPRRSFLDATTDPLGHCFKFLARFGIRPRPWNRALWSALIPVCMSMVVTRHHSSDKAEHVRWKIKRPQPLSLKRVLALVIAYIARSTLWTGSRFRQARTVANDVSQRDCTQPAQRMIVELNRIIANCDSGLTTGPHESQDPEDQPNEGVGQVPQFAEKRQKLHSAHPCGDPDICNASCLKPCRPASAFAAERPRADWAATVRLNGNQCPINTSP